MPDGFSYMNLSNAGLSVLAKCSKSVTVVRVSRGGVDPITSVFSLNMHYT